MTIASVALCAALVAIAALVVLLWADRARRRPADPTDEAGC